METGTTQQGLTPLAELDLGLGATYGYSGADLTNIRTALDHHEVPCQPDPPLPPRTLELRIHGVGGAPPEVNLEAPATLQVAGDSRAGFYRAWYPGGSAEGRPPQEAYCWGNLDTAWWTALWLLLFPFGLYNLAHWALPATGGATARYVAKALLRLQSLILTAMLVATTCYLTLDMLAWQAPQRHLLPSFLGWYETKWSLGLRMAGASVIVFGVIAGLWWLSHRTQGDYEQRQSGPGGDVDSAWTLSDDQLWRGARTVARQRDAHLVACAAVILVIESLPLVYSMDGLRLPLRWVGYALGLVAVLLVISPWTDRESVPPSPSPDERLRSTRLEIAVWITKWVSLGVSVGFAVSRIWWKPDDRTAAALPYDSRVQLFFFWTALGAVFALLLALVAHRPWSDKAVLVRGFASFGIALLATLVSTIFTASLLKSVSQLISSPTFQLGPVPPVSGANDVGFYVPSTAYAGGLAFLVAGILAAVTAITMMQGVSRMRAKKIRSEGGELSKLYAEHGFTRPSAKAAHQVSQRIATSRLTNDAGLILLVVAVPTSVVLVLYQWSLQVGGIRLGHLASAGAYLATLATGWFIVQVRKAVVDPNARKRIGFIWDVVTFWPRACHPLGPPSYAERSVPEVVTRIRRMVGSLSDPADPGDPALAQQAAESFDAQATPAYHEQHSDVLLVGYSQGCPIATAVMAQLPEDARRRVRLLTLASPVRRLYGRTFPTYFGEAQLAKLEEKLTEDGRTRWTNLVRETDYIGGYVRTQQPGRVDQWILDPPVLWGDVDPSPPPTHLHSNWFSDPQTRRFAEDLL